MLYELNHCRNIFLQWIPSHCGIQGNELADIAAKKALNLPYVTLIPLNLKENTRKLKLKLYEVWQKYWDEQVRVQRKGKALKNIRDKV